MTSTSIEVAAHNAVTHSHPLHFVAPSGRPVAVAAPLVTPIRATYAGQIGALQGAELDVLGVCACQLCRPRRRRGAPPRWVAVIVGADRPPLACVRSESLTIQASDEA